MFRQQSREPIDRAIITKYAAAAKHPAYLEIIERERMFNQIKLNQYYMKKAAK